MPECGHREGEVFRLIFDARTCRTSSKMADLREISMAKEANAK